MEPHDKVDRATVWLTADGVAALLALPSRRTVYAFVDQGLLPYHRVGTRLLRFSQADIDECLRRSAEATP